MKAGLLGFAAVVHAASPSPPLSAFIATQHFQPCYNISTLPSLLDGAVQAARLGSTSFKFGMSDRMADVYPYNNEDAPWPKVQSLAELVNTTQVQRLFRNDLHTNFDSMTLWAYTIGITSGFCDKLLPIPPADLEKHRQQFADLTVALMSVEGPGTPQSYWLESWENDWATRCGSYDRVHPPAPAVREAYRDWLQARQQGVELGRQRYCEGHATLRAEVDCTDTASVVRAAGVKVYHGAEVNLVGSCLTNTSCGNIVREVLPHVALDHVSYSSYDTMAKPELADALDLIAAQHNRTHASPERAVFITEFGVPETKSDPATVRRVVDNVLSIARAKDIARVHYWQTINNEKVAGGNCLGSDPPNFNMSSQNGFWTTLPNGTLSWVGQYLQDIIAGRRPMPTPPQ